MNYKGTSRPRTTDLSIRMGDIDITVKHKVTIKAQILVHSTSNGIPGKPESEDITLTFEQASER